ncbi:MAG: hypothetical protein KF874_00100 [Rhizobiaceae bacterium]|nr:hypothetical protein [Rhizobiaceae bacterium]
MLFMGQLCVASPAWALSEIQREDLPPTGEEQPQVAPDSNSDQQPAEPDTSAPADGNEPASEPDENSLARPDVDPNAPLPEVFYDVQQLPEPVRRMRQLLLDAAKTGEVEKLRPLLGQGDAATQLSLADINGDPIAFLKGQSGDPAGEEILAIMEEVLSAGYVHLDKGTPEELYVWPYFFAYPLEKLTPAQKVEIYKIVTASDFDEMQNFGNYIFFRLGITPDGHWAFFVAGE